MKKVLMSVALVSAIAIAAGYSMIGSEKSDVNMSDLTQANVEALAQIIEIGPFCVNTSLQFCVLPDVIVIGDKLEEPYQ